MRLTNVLKSASPDQHVNDYSTGLLLQADAQTFGFFQVPHVKLDACILASNALQMTWQSTTAAVRACACLEWAR